MLAAQAPRHPAWTAAAAAPVCLRHGPMSLPCRRCLCRSSPPACCPRRCADLCHRRAQRCRQRPPPRGGTGPGGGGWGGGRRGGGGGGGPGGSGHGGGVGGKEGALERDKETADQDRVAGRQAAAGVGKLRCAGRRGLPMQVAQRAGRGEPQGRQRAGQQQIDGQQQAQDMRLDHGLTRSTKRSNWIESFCGLSALTAPRVCTFRPSMMIAGFWLDITAKALCRAISSPSVRTASGIWSTLPCSLGGRTWLLTICKPAALKMSRMRCWALLPTWEASSLAAYTYYTNTACAWALAARDWSALP